ncbi:MAG: hypothetical protein WCG19_09745 [Chlorobiaceae bacterium]
MINSKDTVGGRLEAEITREFGSLTKAADAIGVKSGSYFRPYLKNKNGIGMMLRKKLVEAGLDVEFIMEGKKRVIPEESRDSSTEIRRKIEDIRYRMVQLDKDLIDLTKLVLPPMKK